jgi:hypothetical protein
MTNSALKNDSLKPVLMLFTKNQKVHDSINDMLLIDDPTHIIILPGEL